MRKLPDWISLDRVPAMRLYLVHCGFYDPEIADGVYESHANFFVAAESFEEARLKAKEIPEVRAKRMHVDGLQEVEAASGWRVTLIEDPALQSQTLVKSSRHRDLAPKPQAPSSSIALNQ